MAGETGSGSEGAEEGVVWTTYVFGLSEDEQGNHDLQYLQKVEGLPDTYKLNEEILDLVDDEYIAQRIARIVHDDERSRSFVFLVVDHDPAETTQLVRGLEQMIEAADAAEAQVAP